MSRFRPSGLWGFILRRLLLGIVVLILVSILVFLATQALGDPARAILGRNATPASLAALRRQLHLNRPVFQVIALNLAYLAGGIIVIEFVFNYSGIGGAIREAVVNHDLPVIQALAMLIAAVYVILNLLADVATILVTPKLRTRL